jgi:hypothetical protein
MPVSEPPPYSGPFPPKFRGTQVGLKYPSYVDELKRTLRAGDFRFHEPGARVSGIRDAKGVYHVKEGHHRIVAALEILRESGDERPLRELMRWGKWDDQDRGPKDSRPLPSRSWWGAFRNWLKL